MQEDDTIIPDELPKIAPADIFEDFYVRGLGIEMPVLEAGRLESKSIPILRKRLRIPHFYLVGESIVRDLDNNTFVSIGSVVEKVLIFGNCWILFAAKHLVL